MPNQHSKVVVALSGGVDSSLTLVLLKDQGFAVSGLHFLLPTAPEKLEARRQSVVKVGEVLDIPVAFINLQDAFTRIVIQPFIRSYSQGLTPNPCVVCNALIKFDQMLQYANKHDIDYIATGHYAAIAHASGGRSELRRGKDRSKDQSYFLHRLHHTQLSRILFPLSQWTKKETKEKARQLDLPTYNEPESQEICFLPRDDYRLFLEAHLDPNQIKPGEITDEQGRILGEHQGVHRYTIGQRQGLGIASERPYYVKEIRPDQHKVIVGRKEEIFSSIVEAIDFHWLITEKEQKILVEAQPAAPISAQVRYRHEAAGGRLEILPHGKVRFEFNEPQWAVTPGQALVCYQEDLVIGGGWIAKERGQG